MFISNYSNNRRTELADAELLGTAPSVFAAQPMAGVSDNYTFLPTSAIVARMRHEGWAPVGAQEQRVRLDARRGFQKHLIRFQRRDIIAVKGEYAAEVALVNSHDRSSAYQLHAALYRFVCSNGLMVSDSTFQHVSIRHSGHETDEVLEASFRLLAQVPELTSRVEAFRARQLTLAEETEYARQAIALRWDDHTKAPVGPQALLVPRRSEDAGNNLWSVFNRVQERLTQGGMRDYTRRKADGHRFPRTRSISGLDEGIRINKALWGMAEHLLPGQN